ncbi:MAG: family 43 glycosylhydrolase, partial [Stenotrophomonas sp.]
MRLSNLLATLATAGLLWASAVHAADVPAPAWKRGIENQRQADLGNGTFLNPVFAGDRPDPSVLKDGDDYY